jgi:hypothetical protein
MAIAGAEDSVVQLKPKIWWNQLHPDQIHGGPARGGDGALHEPPPSLWVQQSTALEAYSKQPMELARPAAEPTRHAWPLGP